jgi:hypothetical protein
MSIRFGTSHDGTLIGVQLVSTWQAERTLLRCLKPGAACGTFIL